MGSYARKANKKDIKIPRCCGKRMNKKNLGGMYLVSCPICGKIGTTNGDGKFIPIARQENGDVTNEEQEKS